MKKVYGVFLTIYFLIFLSFSIECMSGEMKSTPARLISYWAEYCYRQGTDFDDKRRSYEADRFPCCALSSETEFFDQKRIRELFDPEISENINVFCVANADELATTFMGKKPSNVIQQFNGQEKRLLLQQLQSYEPSHLKFIGELCVLLSGLAGIGVSAYSGYIADSDSMKVKFVSLAAGMCSSAITWYGAKNTIKSYQAFSWWQRCPNFQNLIVMCKTK